MPEPPPVMTATSPFTSNRLEALIDVVAISSAETYTEIAWKLMRGILNGITQFKSVSCGMAIPHTTPPSVCVRLNSASLQGEGGLGWSKLFPTTKIYPQIRSNEAEAFEVEVELSISSTTPNIMPKRKRNALEDDSDHVQQMRKKDISEKLTQSKKLLHRALKTAKGFERQKLGKRLKNAAEAGSNDEVARINREIETLKGLDLDKMTDAQLYKRLLKVKAIAESELLPKEVRKDLPRPEGTEEERKALHNVMSGMWNMKPVKEVMEKVMSGMYIVMGIPAPVAKGKGGKKEPKKGILKGDSVGLPMRVETEEDESLGEGKGETGSGASSWEGFDSGDESEDMEAEGGVKITNEEEEEENEGDDMELDEEALSRYDALIGASSDEESFDESKYNIKHTSQPSARLSLSLSPEPSDSPSPSEVESQSASPLPEKAAKPPKAKAKEAPKKPNGSTFLPTLMGGYWSGSESSASDLEDDAIAAAPVRKNRPGQMARRAIWEKKFGERANHIKTGKGSVAEKRGKGKDDGWDAKRGAKDSGYGGRERGRGRQRDFRQATGENAVAVEPRNKGVMKRDDVGKLHPSWEAAKKAKEVKKTATFQGKKVTFD